MKKITLLLFALFSCWQINAQISAYGFSQSTGTYTPITGGTVLGVPTNDDDSFNAIPIGFTFVFNDISYTQISVQANGFLAFGASVSSSYTAISSGASNNVVSALNRDLQGNVTTGELSHQLSGTAPNRVLTVQWKSYRSYFATGDEYNFQIKLYETTNNIEVVYGAFTQNPDVRTVQVGLRGPSNTAFNNRDTSTNWTATNAGTVNTASCTLATAIVPSTGLTFTWTPPSPCTGTPVAGTVAPESQNACVGFVPADLTLTGFTQGASGITFQWETSTDNTNWNNAAGVTATAAVYDTPAFDGLATVYYRCKVTCSASTLFSYSNVVTVNPPVNPTGQATNLTFANISYTGFTANWTNANGNRRVVYISNAPIVDPTNGSGPALVPATIYGGTGQQVVFDGTGTSVTVTGLNLATQYYVKVIEYARCGTAAPFEYFFNTSTGTNENTVTTSSATALPWEEGFTATTVPSNWITTGWTLGALNAALNEGTTSNYLYKNIYTVGTSGFFTTPIFASVPANYRLTFTNKFRNWSSAVDTTPENSNVFTVSISTDNGATFTEVENVINSGSGNWDLYTLNLSAFTGQSIRIRITSNWVSGDYWAAFDNFKIEPIPSCTEPNSLNVSSITNDSALLGWTEAATSTAWQVQWGVTGFTLGSGTIVPVTENSLALADLNGNTSYSFYVRAVCAVGNESPWVGPFTFKTDCDAVTDYFENFQGIPAVFNGPIVDCFTKGGNGQVYLTTFGGSAPMAGNRLQMSANPLATPLAQESYVSLKPVSNLNTGTHRLRFLAANSFGPATFLELGYIENNVFTAIHQFENITTATQQFIHSPIGLPLGTERLVLKFTNLSSPDAGSATIYIDDVYWEPIPSCAEATGLTVTGVLANSAQLNWTAASPAPAQGYEYYYSTTNTTPGANPDTTTGTLGSVGAGITTAAISSLNPSTTYYVWVRSVCSTSDKSPWTLVVSFITPCAAFTPDYTEAFSTFLPSCWDKFGAGNETTGPTGPTNSGSWFGRNYLNIASPANPAAVINIYFTSSGWLVSPVFNLSAGGYQVKYKVGATQFFSTGPISGPGGTMGSDDFVKFLMSTDGGVTWTVLTTYDAANTPSNLGATATFNIPTVNSTSVKFAFYGNANANSAGYDLDFFVDDFQIQSIPSEAPVCATNVTAVASVSCGNEATAISWTAAAGADGYKVYISTTAGGTATATPITVGSTTYSYVGALNTTYYYKVVPFNATGDATGCTEQSFTTAATGCYCPSLPTSEDGSGMTNAVVGTTNFPINLTSTPYYSNQTATPVDLNQNTLANIQLTYNTSTYPYSTYVWIDLNDNFIFETSELMFQGIAPSNGVLNASFTMSATAPLGAHRMRISGGDGLAPNPCFSGSWANTVDFTVNVIQEDLSTGDFDNANFKVYPNPVTDILTISYSNEISEVVVYNLLGQQVLAVKPNATQSQVDLSVLTAGTYLVKVTSEEVTKTVKVVKN